MTKLYGPWAMPMEMGSNPQLGTFWKNRLARLPSASRTSPALSRRHLLWLSAAALLVIVLPTFRSAPATAAEDYGHNSDQEIKKAIEAASVAKRPVPALPADKEPWYPPPNSYVIKVRVIDDKGMVLSEPHLITQKDQEVCMETFSESPFVVGFYAEKEVKQPRIVVLKEGIVMKTTIAGEKSDGATLDITVEQSKIGDVDTKEIGSNDTVQSVSLDTHKKRIIDFVKYGEVFRIPLGEKSAKADGARIEMVFGPAGMDIKLPERKSSGTEPTPEVKPRHG